MAVAAGLGILLAVEAAAGLAYYLHQAPECRKIRATIDVKTEGLVHPTQVYLVGLANLQGLMFGLALPIHWPDLHWHLMVGEDVVARADYSRPKSACRRCTEVLEIDLDIE